MGNTQGKNIKRLTHSIGNKENTNENKSSLGEYCGAPCMRMRKSFNNMNNIENLIFYDDENQHVYDLVIVGFEEVHNSINCSTITEICHLFDNIDTRIKMILLLYHLYKLDLGIINPQYLYNSSDKSIGIRSGNITYSILSKSSNSIGCGSLTVVGDSHYNT